MQISGIERRRMLLSASRRRMHARWRSLKRKLIPVPHMACNDIRLKSGLLDLAHSLLNGEPDVVVRDISLLDFRALPSGKRILMYGYVHGMHAMKSVYAAIELLDSGNRVLYVGAHIGEPPWLEELMSRAKEVHAFAHGDDFLEGPLVHMRQPRYFMALLTPEEKSVNGRLIDRTYNVVYHSCPMEGHKPDKPVDALKDKQVDSKTHRC